MATAIGRVASGAGNAVRAVGRLGGAVGGLGRGLAGGLRLVSTFAAALGVAFGISALRGAERLQEQLATINTIARLNSASTEQLGKDLRAIAIDRGVRLDDLTESYYEFLSAGIGIGKSFDALGSDEARLAVNTQVLKATTDLAIGGLSTQTEAVGLMAFALNTYGLNSVSIQKKVAAEAGITATTIQGASTVIADYFAKAVEIGVVKADQIAKTFSTVGLTAKNAGIGIDQIAAAYAYLTQRGFTAARVTVAMNRAILEMIKPGKTLSEVMAKTGDNFEKIAREKGLQAALQQMRDDAQRLNIPFVDLFKRQEAFRFALALTSNTLDKTDKAAAGYREALDKIHQSTKDVLRDPITGEIRAVGTAAIQAYIRSDTLSRNIIKLQEAFRSIGITIGYWFLAPVNQIVKSITGAIRAVDLWLQSLNPAQVALARQAATVLGAAAAFIALSGGLQAFLIVASRIAPVLGVTATNLYGLQKAVGHIFLPLGILAALLGGFYVLVNNNVRGFGQFRHQLDDMKTVVARVGDVFHTIVDAVRNIWAALSDGADVGHTAQVNFDRIGKAVENLGPSLGRVATFVARLALTLGTILVQALQRAIPAIIGWAISVAKAVAPSLQKAAIVLVAWVVDTIPKVLAALGQFFGEVVANLQRAAPGIWAAAVAWGTGLVRWVAIAAPQVINALGQLLGQIVAWVASVAPTILSALGTWAIAFATWFATEALPAVLKGLGDLIAGITAWLQQSQVIAAITNGVISWAAGFVAGLAYLLVRIGSWVVANAGTIAGFFLEVGAQILSGLLKFFSDHVGEIVAGGIALGFQVIVGLVQGIASNPGAVVGAVGAVLLGTAMFALVSAAASQIAFAFWAVKYYAVVGLATLQSVWGQIAADIVQPVAAGIKHALAYIGGLLAQGPIGVLFQRMSALWTGIAASSAPAAAAAGTTVGTSYGIAAGLGAVAALAGLALTAYVTVTTVTTYIGDQKNNVDLINQVTKDSTSATLEALQGMRQKVAESLKNEQGRFDPFEDFFGLSQQNNLQAQLDALDKIIADHQTALLKSHGKAAGDIGVPAVDPLAALMDSIAESRKKLADEAPYDTSGLLKGTPQAGTDAGKQTVQNFTDEINKLPANVGKNASNLRQQLKDLLTPATPKTPVFKSDTTRIAEYNKIIRNARASMKTAEAHNDTATVLALRGIITDAQSQIDGLKNGAKLLKQEAAAAKAAKEAAKAAEVTKAKIAQVRKLRNVAETGNFSRADYGLPKPKTPEQIEKDYYRPYKGAVDKTTTAIQTLPVVVGAAAAAAGTAWTSAASLNKDTIVSSIETPVNSITTFLSGLSWFSYGANLIQSFINGIASKLPSAKNAGYAVAHSAARGVHAESPPKEGPLHEIDKWGARLVTTYSSAIMGNLSPAKNAGYAMAGAVAGGIGSGPKNIIPLSVSGGRFGGSGSGSLNDRELQTRHTELLGQIAANSALAAAASARQASNDPMAGGPLAARGTLSALKHLSHGEG